jgi:hypothetical protein
VARKRASNDADVSTISPIIPYGRVSPSTAGRLAFQVVPFPRVAQVKPAPGMPWATRRFVSTLRALRCPTLRRALVSEQVCSVAHCHARSQLLYPRGLRSGHSSKLHRWDSHPLERQLASLHGLGAPLGLVIRASGRKRGRCPRSVLGIGGLGAADFVGTRQGTAEVSLGHTEAFLA